VDADAGGIQRWHGPNSVQPQMVYVTYGEPEQTIIVTLDHTFLQAGGKLIRANMLIVGDSLLGLPASRSRSSGSSQEYVAASGTSPPRTSNPPASRDT